MSAAANLSDLRQEYMRAGLAEADADADAFKQFDRWFREAVDAQLPLANAMTLATAAEDGAPDARIVLLKSVEDGGFVFYTNYGSRKGRQLATRPEACLVFFWPQLERQVRIEGRAEQVSAADSDAYFMTRPVGARLSAHASAQSSAVGGRKFLEDALLEQRKKFGDNPPRPPRWGGYRVIPARIEFWQGRENRLHDRLLYTRRGTRWQIERLAP